MKIIFANINYSENAEADGLEDRFNDPMGWQSLMDVEDDAEESDNRPLMGGGSKIKNEPAMIKKAQIATEKANVDLLSAKATIGRAEKAATKRGAKEDELLVAKLECWEDILGAALDKTEERLDPGFDWSHCDLKETQQKQNVDINKIKTYVTTIKVLQGR